MRNKRKRSKMNAVPVEVDGIKFKSKLEAYCYSKLKENKLKAKYEGKKFTVLDGFSFQGRKIQPITYTPDFVGRNFIIECKGHPNESFPLRWKLFLHYLHVTKSKYSAYLPHSPTEVDKVVQLILEKKNEVTKKDKRVRSKWYKQLIPFMV